MWGPIGFVVGAVAAGTRQPGYSHRTNHVSGLAAHGEASASLMVPGFLALAASQAVVPAPTLEQEIIFFCCDLSGRPPTIGTYPMRSGERPEPRFVVLKVERKSLFYDNP